MLPIPEGSWITSEFVQDWYTITSGKPYIILTLGDGAVFKIVDNLIQDEGKLRLYSLNLLYKPYDVPVSDIKEVWRFVNFISTEIPEPDISDSNLTQTVYEIKREMEVMKRKLYEDGGV